MKAPIMEYIIGGGNRGARGARGAMAPLKFGASP